MKLEEQALFPLKLSLKKLCYYQNQGSRSKLTFTTAATFPFYAMYEKANLSNFKQLILLNWEYQNLKKSYKIILPAIGKEVEK